MGTAAEVLNWLAIAVACAAAGMKALETIVDLTPLSKEDIYLPTMKVWLKRTVNGLRRLGFHPPLPENGGKK